MPNESIALQRNLMFDYLIETTRNKAPSSKFQAPNSKFQVPISNLPSLVIASTSTLWPAPKVVIASASTLWLTRSETMTDIANLQNTVYNSY